MYETDEIVHLPINRVHVNKKNPRVIKDEAFKRLVKSLRESPELFRARPLICSDRTGEFIILAGNMRYLAARELKRSNVPVFIMRGLSEAQEKAIMILDNGIFGEWNFSVLVREWSSIPLGDWGVKLPKSWLTVTGNTVEDYFDAGPEADSTFEDVTKPGDIWELGKHRLMCGDPTNKEDVALLLDSQYALLLLTDPTQGVHLTGKADDSSGDGQTESGVKRCLPAVGDEIREAVRKVYLLTQEMDIKKIIFWGGNHFTDFLPPSPSWVVWDKGSGAALKNGADCELAWTSFTSSSRIYRHSRNGYTRKGKCRVKGKKSVKTTQKSLGLFALCIENYSEGEEIIFDPFLGCGNTLIAAEQLGRVCYGMEGDPVRCDMIRKRLNELRKSTGVKHVQ